jgi:hypothetical protein
LVGIGFFISAGLVGLVAVKHGYAQETHNAPRCSLHTLKGRYLFALTGTLFPPAFRVTEPTPLNAAGFHIFNGDGAGADIVTFTLGGATVLSNSVTPITYTVNADCTGSYTVPNGPSFGLFIAPDGESIATIATGPPGNEVSGISKECRAGRTAQLRLV